MPDNSYTNDYPLDFTQVLSEVGDDLNFAPDNLLFIDAVGVAASAFGYASLARGNRVLAITGFDALNIPAANIDFNNLSGTSSLDFNKTLVVGDTALNFGSDDKSHKLFIQPLGFESTLLPLPFLESSIRYITGSGFYSQTTGVPAAANLNKYLFSSAILSSLSFGSSKIFNNALVLKPKGIDSLDYGKAAIYNLKQYLRHNQPYSNNELYGKPALGGGVRPLLPIGFLSTLLGKIDVKNPTEDQLLNPTGINSLKIPEHAVSPRMVYADGFYKSKIGSPAVRISGMAVSGFVGSYYGTQTIWFHTRSLLPTGVVGFLAGNPRVFDPTQFVSPSSSVQSAVFGDIAIRNKSKIARPLGVIAGTVSPWSLIENYNRSYLAQGIHSQLFGNINVANKTPSIFAESIEGKATGTPAIGYRFRQVKPSGFDRLALGSAKLIKSPELSVLGIDAAGYGDTTIWFKNRIVEHYGADYQTLGTPTTWFRYRYYKPKAWQSDSYGAPVLTHGNRGIDGRGFVTDRHGVAWISFNNRVVSVKHINNVFPSIHKVGGTQTINTDGYIATLFGERIIPESMTLYPLGFTGVFGTANTKLATMFISPWGYISVGDQHSDRWGLLNIYNLTQYIAQEYDFDSGLVPPKWSEWTLIENRDKSIGAIGSLFQKFGYSSIYNNATPLLPVGISDPASSTKNTFVSHDKRSLPLTGIEPPVISTWSSIYNAARVVSTHGDSYSAYGQPFTESNRRYYKDVGRIDDLVLGDPMIAYRIRGIDIESRYSISPPQVNLPTFDLWTRYLSLSGGDTSSYGLSVLTIQLRNIAPSWAHRDTHGQPALKNVTPELGVYGHDSSEFGTNSLRTEWRYVQAVGDSSSLFGGASISDRRLFVDVRGWRSSQVNTKAQLVKTESNPNTLQYIWLSDESGSAGGEGYGIFFDENILGKRLPSPSLNQNVLYPKGIKADSYGLAFTWSNNIVVESGIGIDGVPKTLTISNYSNKIAVTGIPRSDIKVSVPRVSPHTIWSVKEAPTQAISNHKAIDELHYVGERFGGGSGSSRVGRPKIESTIRTIYVDSNKSDHSIVSNRHSIDSTIRIVDCYGFRLVRFGIPSIPFTPQGIEIRGGIQATIFGRHSAAPPLYNGPRYLEPLSWGSLVFSRSNIDNLHRRLYVKGEDYLLLGKSIGGDKPFMWQGLRIGERIPTSIGAGDTSLLGSATIGLLIRGIEPQGLLGFSSGYDLENFYERMTVVNSYKYIPDQKIISEVTIPSSGDIPTPDVRLGQRLITPDGNSDQFRKGGYHA